MEYEQVLGAFPYLRGFIPSAIDNDAYESGLGRDSTLDECSRFPNLARWRDHIDSIPIAERRSWTATPAQSSIDCADIDELEDNLIEEEEEEDDDVEEEEEEDSTQSSDREQELRVVQDWKIADDFEESAKKMLSKEREVTAFQKTKLDRERIKNWNRFYKRNDVNFFKDRHYLSEVFFKGDAKGLLLEIGSGVGNSALPLCVENPQLRVVATDCSDVAIDLLTKEAKARGLSDRLQGLVCDATCHTPDKLVWWRNRCDYVLILFCLSAVDPEKHQDLIKRAAGLLKPGGHLLFRDYGRYDWTQMRFTKEKHLPAKIKENFYTRHDGTMAYFFTSEEVVSMCDRAGLEKKSMETIYRQITNRKTQVSMRRIWLNGQFQRKQESTNDDGERDTSRPA